MSGVRVNVLGCGVPRLPNFTKDTLPATRGWVGCSMILAAIGEEHQMLKTIDTIINKTNYY